MEDQYEQFFIALREACDRAGSANKLGRLSGVATNSITRWLNKERTPSLEGIVPLLPFLDWPKRGSSTPVIKRMGSHAEPEPVVGDDLKKIPVMLEAGAGNPVDIWEGEPSKWIDVLPRYYSTKVRAVEVVGDSMEPTILKGAIVGVKPFQGTLREGGIYLCQLPYFGVVVKRVKANGMKGMLLISDNHAYAPMEVPFEECEHLIIGEVDWCWQKV